MLIAPLAAAILSLSCATAAAPRTAPTPPDGFGAQRQQWLEMFARGYFPGRSGQIFFVPREGDFLVNKDPLYQFMHGSAWGYDASIPLLFYGPGFIRAGAWDTPVTQQDVAPTLARVLQTAPPATAIGRPLTEALQPAPRRPRIVALFVLDGMRADYLTRHADRLPTLTRWKSEGAWFGNARVNALPTATSIGHATIGTGADPRVHGLVVNRLFNRITGKSQESYHELDPRELMALTLADVWNVTTGGRAVIIGQGGAIRATAGLVGRGACLVNGHRVQAASYTTRDGGWETNPECYEMPAALKAINARTFWEQAGGVWMGHDIATPSRFRASSVFQHFEGEALAAVIDASNVGQDEITDLVLVNFKGPDYVSHAYGPDSAEMREQLAELDRQLARAVQLLETRAGDGGLVIAVTADHGMPPEPAAGARRIAPGEVVAALDERFSPTGPSIVHYFGDPANAQIHLDAVRLQELGFTLRDVAAFLQDRFFLAVFTEDEVRQASANLPLGR